MTLVVGRVDEVRIFFPHAAVLGVLVAVGWMALLAPTIPSFAVDEEDESPPRAEGARPLTARVRRATEKPGEMSKGALRHVHQFD